MRLFETSDLGPATAALGSTILVGLMGSAPNFQPASRNGEPAGVLPPGELPIFPVP